MFYDRQQDVQCENQFFFLLTGNKMKTPLFFIGDANLFQMGFIVGDEYIKINQNDLIKFLIVAWDILKAFVTLDTQIFLSNYLSSASSQGFASDLKPSF